jgi:hypothetical protein
MRATPDDMTTLMEDGTGTSVRGADWDDMAATFNRFSPGTDLGPLLSQLPGGDCAVPHWGYVIEGSFTVHYADGQEETVSAGQAFYMPPHHDRVTTDGGVLLAEFTPAGQAKELFGHIADVMQSAR